MLPSPPSRRRRILLLGATGTIGRATAQMLVRRGYETVCVVRSGARPQTLSGNTVREALVSDLRSLSDHGIRGERFDALISCLASRTGVPADAWAIDHQAHLHALAAARAAGITHMVLLSAICVQKPRLAFQHAKLAFEQALINSGITFSIVRPTAYFKSLSGQVARVMAGKPYLIFGDGTLTACKPVSDADLANYIVDCLEDPARHNRILPIGGPGPAITPREQGEAIFALLGKPVRFRRVPPGLLRMAGSWLSACATVLPRLAAKAELARIGHYYATESMLVLNPETGQYDAEATPSTGSQTLFEHYARLIRGELRHERGEHAVF